MKSILARALRLFVIVGGAVLCVMVVFAIWPGTLLLAVPGIGVSSPYCSRWKAAADFNRLERFRDIEKQFAAGSRIERREGGFVLWSTPKGRYWLPEGPADLLPTLLTQQERRIYGSVRPGDVIVDCGAHVGTFTRAALDQGAALVVAVEPAPEAVECLHRNLAAEIAARKVIVCPKGIWDSDTVLKFYLNGNSDAADSFIVHGDSSRSVEMPVTTVDTLAREHGLARISLIKADVKGATERAVKGAASVIARDHPRLALATEEPPENPQSIANLLFALAPGYRLSCGACIVVGRQIRTDVVFFE